MVGSEGCGGGIPSNPCKLYETGQLQYDQATFHHLKMLAQRNACHASGRMGSLSLRVIAPWSIIRVREKKPESKKGTR